MNHIVIGVDGSPAATAAARWAACEAAMRDVELTIVHVLRSAPDALPLTGWPAIPLPAEVGEDQLAQGEKILDDTLEVIANTIGVRQPRSIASRVCIGAVVPTLSGFSHKGSQMIVVGRRAKGGYIVLCSAQLAAACCIMRTARSRWSTTTRQRIHRAQHRLSWGWTARQPPSQRSRSPSMKPRDAAWTWSRCTVSNTPTHRWREHCLSESWPAGRSATRTSPCTVSSRAIIPLTHCWTSHGARSWWSSAAGAAVASRAKCSARSAPPSFRPAGSPSSSPGGPALTHHLRQPTSGPKRAPDEVQVSRLLLASLSRERVQPNWLRHRTLADRQRCRVPKFVQPGSSDVH